VTATATSSRQRLGFLDAGRGLAVLVMVADHALMLALALGGPDWLRIPRYTVTRLALVLFAGIAGYLLAHRGVRARWGTMTGWGVALSWLAMLTGAFPTPDVLVVLGFVTVGCGPLIARWPWVAVTVCAVGAVNFPFTAWAGYGGGYDPFYVGVFVALGVLVCRYASVSGLATVRERPALAWAGRHALGLYVTQAVAFNVAWVVLQ
jgi:uncharacterized membrane protein